MKDIIQLWGRLAGRTYTAVNTNNNTRDTGDECIELATNETRNRARAKAKNRKSILSFVIIGLLGIASGCFIIFVNPYDFLFKLKCVFSDGGEVFEMWRNPPVDLYLRVFLFNVTNRDEFLAGKEKLKIEEVGPYVYKEVLSHENITFNENGTLTAIPNHPLVWVPELSEGRQEDDQLILPNIALLSIAHVVRDASYFTRLGLNLLIRQTDAQPLVQMSAREFMMGYKSPLLTLGNKFMPGWITFDKLGLIDRMYDFDGDYETVYTGETEVSKSGLLDTYRGSTNLPQWNGRHCSNIQGASDGTKFPSHVKPNDSLLFFRKSMCRSQWLVRVNSTERSSLDAYWYTFAPNAMDNGYYDPENVCYCREGADKCFPPGLLDVTGCYYGFPIALSYPHFLHSDPSFLNMVEGSKPDVNKHETYFVIQPESGLPLDVAVRFQINMAIGDVSKIARAEKFSNLVLPMLWTENRMYSLPDFLAARFNLYLNVLPKVETVIMYLLFISGILFILTALYRLFQIKSKWTTDNKIGTQWLEDDSDKNFDFLRVENRKDMNSKELEVYYSSLITPMNQDLTFQEFQELKEDVV